jgi:hypothetical protein
MRKDPDVQFALPSRQLQKLIMEPLHAAMHEETFQPCIIVIDALDECIEVNTASTILLALSESADHTTPLRFFITSRPVDHVLRGFHTTGLMKDTGALVLHSIPPDIAARDIQVYLKDRLSSMCNWTSSILS